MKSLAFLLLFGLLCQFTSIASINAASEEVCMAAITDTSLTNYHYIIEPQGGKKALDAFNSALENSLDDSINTRSSSSVVDGQIRKFNLDIGNPKGANVKIQLTGFEKFEVWWRVDADKKLYDLTYRFDNGEKRIITQNDLEGSRKVRVRIKNENF